jgi:hypothetical protein
VKALHTMMPRPVKSGKRAANDNEALTHASAFARMRVRSRRDGFPLLRAEPLRIDARPLLVVLLSGLILVALGGAFLIGLAAVGVLAAAIVGFELARRALRRRAPLGMLDHQVVG